MIGAIIGDAIGSVYEFNNTKDYDFKILSKNSDITDDSVLTAAVACWQLAGGKEGMTQEWLEKCLVDFANRYPAPMGGYGNGFQCWLNAAVRKPYNSWGNGSAMRVSSVGWLYDDLDETERVAGLSAEITHNHPEGIKGAQATAAAIWMARRGYDKFLIRDTIQERYGYNLKASWKDIQPTYGWEDSCQGTVPAALIAFLDSNDFEDAIRKAVSLGGDSDTIGAITGAVAEAYYKEIPEHIVTEVLGKLPEDLMTVISAFIRKSDAYREAAASYIPESFLNDGDISSLMIGRVTPEFITSLRPGKVFVFGSNLQGAHGGGAARIALNNFGAVWGQGVGLQGQSYAIPTMHGGVDVIKPYVDEFIGFAAKHPELFFYVTRVGCGIAGFRDSEIAPLFAEAMGLSNVALPKSFIEYLK